MWLCARLLYLSLVWRGSLGRKSTASTLEPEKPSREDLSLWSFARRLATYHLSRRSWARRMERRTTQASRCLKVPRQSACCDGWPGRSQCGVWSTHWTATDKHGPNMVCFAHFDLKMCFAPQRCAIFHFSLSTRPNHKSWEKRCDWRLC